MPAIELPGKTLMTAGRYADGISRGQNKYTNIFWEGNERSRAAPDPVRGHRAARYSSFTDRTEAGRAFSLSRILQKGIPPVAENERPGGFPS
jgi:hypothetical protein